MKLLQLISYEPNTIYNALVFKEIISKSKKNQDIYLTSDGCKLVFEKAFSK